MSDWWSLRSTMCKANIEKKYREQCVEDIKNKLEKFHNILQLNEDASYFLETANRFNDDEIIKIIVEWTKKYKIGQLKEYTNLIEYYDKKTNVSNFLNEYRLRDLVVRYDILFSDIRTHKSTSLYTSVSSYACDEQGELVYKTRMVLRCLDDMLDAKFDEVTYENTDIPDCLIYVTMDEIKSFCDKDNISEHK